MSFGTVYISVGILLFWLIPLAIVVARKKSMGLGVLLVVLLSWIGLVIHMVLTQHAPRPTQ